MQLLDIIDEGDFSRITDYVSNRYPKSHPSSLYSSCFTPNENLLFMDIETLGLKGVPLILIGVARVESNHILVDQYLLRNLNEESAALEAFVSHVDDDTVFVSFNGQTFDVPYIENRLRHHGLKENIQRYHLDFSTFQGVLGKVNYLTVNSKHWRNIFLILNVKMMFLAVWFHLFTKPTMKQGI